MRDNCSYKVKANNVIAYVKREKCQDTNTHSIKVLDKETKGNSDSNEDGRGKLTATATIRHRRSKKVVPTAEDMQPHRMNRILNRCQQAELYWTPSHEDDNCAVVDNMSMDDGNFQVTKLKSQGNPRIRFRHENNDSRKTVWPGPQFHGHGDHFSSMIGPHKNEFHRGSANTEPPYSGTLSPSPSQDGSDNHDLFIKESGDNYQTMSAKDTWNSRDNSPYASATSRSVDGTYYNGNHDQGHHRATHEDHHHRPSHLPHEEHHHHRVSHAAHDDHHRVSKAPHDTLPCIALCCCCRLAQLQQGGEPCCLGLRLAADHTHERPHQHGHPKPHEEPHRASYGTQSEPSQYAHHASYAHHHDHSHPDHGNRESVPRHHEDRYSQYEEHEYSDPRDHHKRNTRDYYDYPEQDHDRRGHSTDYDHRERHSQHVEHYRKSHSPHPDRHHDYPEHPYDHGPHHGGDHSPHADHYNREHHHKGSVPPPDRHHDYTDHPYDHGPHHGEDHSPHGDHYNREHHHNGSVPHPDRHHDYTDHPYDHRPHHSGDHSPHGDHYNREHHHKSSVPHPDRHHDYPDHSYDHGPHHGDHGPHHGDHGPHHGDHGPHHGRDHSPHEEYYNREHHHKSHVPHPDRHHDYPDHPYDHGPHHGDHGPHHSDHGPHHGDHGPHHGDHGPHHGDHGPHHGDHGPHHGGDHSPHGEHNNKEHHRISHARHVDKVRHDYPNHYDRDSWRSHEEFLSQGYTFDQGTDCPPQCKAAPDDSCQAGGCCLPYLVTSCTIHGDVSGDLSKKTTSDNFNNTTNSCSDQQQCPSPEGAPIVWNPKNTQDECNHCFDLCEVQNEWQQEQEALISRPSDQMTSEEQDRARILIRPFQEPQLCASPREIEQSPVKNGFRVKAYMNNMAPSPKPDPRPLTQVPKSTQSSYHCCAGQARLVSPRAARAQVVSPRCTWDPTDTGCKDAREVNWNAMTIKVSTKQKPSESQPKTSTLIKVNTKRYPS